MRDVASVAAASEGCICVSLVRLRPGEALGSSPALICAIRRPPYALLASAAVTQLPLTRAARLQVDGWAADSYSAYLFTCKHQWNGDNHGSDY
jgi:hypothetical protein